jgi:hypothetical protein
MAETVGSYGVDSFFSDLVHCDKRISKGFALVLFHLLALVGGAGFPTLGCSFSAHLTTNEP